MESVFRHGSASRGHWVCDTEVRRFTQTLANRTNLGVVSTSEGAATVRERSAEHAAGDRSLTVAAPIECLSRSLPCRTPGDTSFASRFLDVQAPVAFWRHCRPRTLATAACDWPKRIGMRLGWLGSIY